MVYLFVYIIEIIEGDKNKMKFLVIGAHPDDTDILFGGTAIKLSRKGHEIVFVSVTNGDTGHHIMSREETARVRANEVMESKKKLGISEYVILPHGCGIESTVENRKEIVRVIRKYAPDVVLTHRLCDYHPDHRATAQLVIDSSYVCRVPHFCDDAKIPDKTPIFAHTFDKFLDPRPIRADAVVEMDSVLEEKIAALACHKSQFFEWMPWLDNIEYNDETASPEERRQVILDRLQRFRVAADLGRERLISRYGELGKSITYAEIFEQSPYGKTVSADEFQAIFE